MPLLILGLFLLIGLLIYAIYNYLRSDEDRQKSPNRREAERRKRRDSSDSSADTILFLPTDEDIEIEKRKRNI